MKELNTSPFKDAENDTWKKSNISSIEDAQDSKISGLIEDTVQLGLMIQEAIRHKIFTFDQSSTWFNYSTRNVTPQISKSHFFF